MNFARESAIGSTHDALEESAAAIPSIHSWQVTDDVVMWAVRMVNEMGVLEKVEQWELEDRKGPGGAPRTFEVEALLVAIVVCARQGRPLTARAFRDMLFRNISTEMRSLLGVPDPPVDDDFQAWMANYRNVRTRFHGLVGLMDPSWLPKNRTVSADMFEALLIPYTEEGQRQRDIRYARLSWFCNQILGASVAQMNREERRRWQGSVGVDATPVKAFAQQDRRVPGKESRSERKLLTSSSDPDAGLYMRKGDHNGDAALGVVKKRMWAFELSIAVMGTEDPSAPATFPQLVVGMAPLHRPGVEPGRNGVEAIRSIHERGLPARYLAADRAYSNEQPENFQLPVKALGYDVVFDYREDQLGVKDGHGGSVQVEGRLYCPAMPLDLKTATVDVRRKSDDPLKISPEVYTARIESRRSYALRPNGRPDKKGHQRLICPAAGTTPTMICARKPKSRAKAMGKPRVSLNHLLISEPLKVCEQQTVTLPPEVGAKFAQKLPFGTPEWEGRYHSLRNTIEGVNGTLKDGSYAALGDPLRRRIRGQAAQSIFVAFLIFAVNIQKIDKFRELAVVDPDGTKRAGLRKRRRTTDALERWKPETPPTGNSPPDDLPLAS